MRAAVVAALVAAVGSLAWWWSDGADPPGRTLPPSANPTHAAVDWPSLLAELDGRRSDAFARADTAPLATVYAPGTRVLADDTADVAALRNAGAVATGVRHEIVDVAPEAITPDRVRLRVVDRMPSYLLRHTCQPSDAGGEVVRTVPGRGDRTTMVHLTLTGGRWLIDDIVDN